MITFDVIEDPHGWNVRMGERMSTPFWSKALAIQEANCLAEAIRRHGQSTRVLIHGLDTDRPPLRIAEVISPRLDELLRGCEPPA